jgi:hypothetical protein
MFPRDPHIVTCSGCGSELPVRDLRLHVCDWWRWLDHQVHLRRDELGRFEHELGAYLGSRRGRFDLWYWERERLRRTQARASASAARRASSSSTAAGSSPRAASST